MTEGDGARHTSLPAARDTTMTSWQLLGLAAAALFGTATGLMLAAEPTTFLLTQTGTSNLDKIPSKRTGASSRLDSNQLTSRSYTLAYDQLNAEDSLIGANRYAVQGKHAGGGRLPYVIGSKGKDSYMKHSDMNLKDAGKGSIIGYDRRHDGRFHLSSESDYEEGSRRNYGLGNSMYGGHGGLMRDVTFMNHGSGYDLMNGIRMNPMMNYPMGQSLGGYRFGGLGPHHQMGNHMNYLAGGGGYPMPYRRPYMASGTGHGYPGMGMLGYGGMMPGHQGMNYGHRGGAHGYALGGFMPGGSFGGGFGHNGGFMIKKRSSSNEISEKK